jgi:integrase
MHIRLHGVNVIRRRLAGRNWRTYYYHRASGTRLPDDPISPEFVARLAELNKPKSASARFAPDTLDGLIVSYLESAEFGELKDATKRQYRMYLDLLRKMWGQFKVADFQRKHVRKLREKFKDKARTANYVVQIFRLLMNVAIEMGLRETNPAARPRMLKTGPGHMPWPDAAIQSFHAKAPKEMVAALMLGLYTGQREGDCLRMTWASFGDGTVQVVQEKTGEELWIPAHRKLVAFLKTVERQSPIILVSKTGLPFKADHFRHQFHEAVVACELQGLTFHGLRAKATEMLAEAGCTEREIMAVTGHKTHAMVTRYLERAQKKERARSAIRKLESHRE